ncbi:hypothetical protein EDD17DRAFT_1120189 [Pisolithus thermaeus]|nr:hypothetical protein EDD17DRAFT_1120189 [Pisolithus thermaeus]
MAPRREAVSWIQLAWAGLHGARRCLTPERFDVAAMQPAAVALFECAQRSYGGTLLGMRKTSSKGYPTYPNGILPALESTGTQSDWKTWSLTRPVYQPSRLPSSRRPFLRLKKEILASINTVPFLLFAPILRGIHVTNVVQLGHLRKGSNAGADDWVLVMIS